MGIGYAQTNTITSGNWNTAGNWTSGVPTGGNVGTVSHEMTLNTNISLYAGSITLNAAVTDPPAGTNYSVSLSNSSRLYVNAPLTLGGNISLSNNGYLDVNANITTGTGGISMSNNTTLIVRTGATLVLNGNSSFSNSSSITVEPGGVLIINGDVNASNNVPFQVDGELIINGSYQSSNNVAIAGDGNITTSGSITTNNSSSVFGQSPYSCSGPCSGSNGCSYTNSITTANQSICSGSTISAWNANNPGTGSTYQWQYYTASMTGGYQNAPGTSTNQNYTYPNAITETTYFRRRVTRSGCTVNSNIRTASVSGATAGQIGNPQTICGASFNPTAITSIINPTNFTSRKWQRSTDLTTWTDIASSNNDTYDPPTISVTTHYRRVALSAGCPEVYSNVVTMTVTGNNPVSVSINSSDADNSICNGNTVVFTATPTNGGTSPAYQWQRNTGTGWSNILGATNNTYSTSGLVNNERIRVNLTSNITCPTGNPATSGAITTTVNSNLPVSATISSSDADNTICSGTSVTFSVNPTNGGTLPAYQWQRNTGTGWSNILGATNNTYSTSGLINNEQIRVNLTSNIACPTGNPANSGSITTTVNPSLPVSVSISANPGNVICSGSSVIFTATPTNGGTTPSYQWKINSINSGTNNAIFSTSSLQNNDIVSVELSSNASCAINTPATSNLVTVTVNSIGIWLGTTSNWNSASNWCGGIPTSTQNVTINSGTPYNPTITATANANNITINSGATLTISGNNTLNIYGNWNNNGILTPNNGTVRFTGPAAQSISGNNTFKNLTINNTTGVSITSGVGNTQTVEGIIALTGTLSTNNNLILDLTNNGMIQGPASASGSDGIIGNITVKRTMPAVGAPSWHYISTPLGYATTIAEYNDNLNYNYNGIGTYYWYDEKVRNADKNVGFKPYYGPNGLLGGPTLRGVAIYQTTPSLTLDITGPYNHYAAYNNLQLSLTPYTTGTVNPVTSSESDGWYLIGNPYPSALDWNAIYPAHTNNVSGSVYVYNNSLGRIGYYNGGTGIDMDGPIIPAMQSFFVQAVNLAAPAVDRNISINHTSRSTGSQAFYRKASLPTLRIKLNNGTLYDETVIRFADDATDIFDASYDAVKFEVGAPHPHLSSNLASREYAINTLEGITLSAKEIPLISRINQDGNYTFTFSEVESIDPSYAIYLEDLVTGTIYNVRNQSTVEFSALNTDNENRFILKFEPETITATNHYSANGQIKFIHTGSKNLSMEFYEVQSSSADILVTDVLGREVYNLKHVNISSGQTQLNFAENGLYIVKVTYDNHISTKSIMVSE